MLLLHRWPNRKRNGARFLKGWWRWRSAGPPVTWRTGKALLSLFTSLKTPFLTEARQQARLLLHSTLFGGYEFVEISPDAYAQEVLPFVAVVFGLIQRFCLRGLGRTCLGCSHCTKPKKTRRRCAQRCASFVYPMSHPQRRTHVCVCLCVCVYPRNEKSRPCQTCCLQS